MSNGDATPLADHLKADSNEQAAKPLLVEKVHLESRDMDTNHGPKNAVGFATLPLELQLEIASHLRWPDASFSDTSLNPTPFTMHDSHMRYQQQQQFPSSERQLLKLRLVSRNLGNAVALSPSFWHEIHFNKKLYLRTSSAPLPSFALSFLLGPPNPSANATILASQPSLYSYAHPPPFQPTITSSPSFQPIRAPAPLPQPSLLVRPFHGIDSDANLLQAHRQSWAHAIQQQPSTSHRTNLAAAAGLGAGDQSSVDPAAGASLFISPPRSTSSLHQAVTTTAMPPGALAPTSAAAAKPPGVLWQERMESFLCFMQRIAANPETAVAVHRVAVEDMSSRPILNDLWRVLVQMPELQELCLKRSSGLESFPEQVLAIRQDDSKSLGGKYGSWGDWGCTRYSTASSSPSPSPLSWRHLRRLDLTESAQLCDLRGLCDAMPALTEVVLVGCQGLTDFRPLVRRGYVHEKQEQGQDHSYLPQRSALQILVLSQTKLTDRDLIEIVQHSPDLRELRLEQCYQLTVDALLAIGQGRRGQSSEPSSLLEETSASAVAATVPTVPTVRTPMCPNLRILSLKGCWDLEENGVRALAGCPRLELLIIRGLRGVREETVDWLHDQGVPLRKVLSPLGHWRHFQQA